MINPLDLIPLPYRLAILGVVVAIIVGAATWQLHSYGAAQYKEGIDAAMARWAAAELVRSEKARAAEVEARKEEARRAAAQLEIENAHQAQLAQAAADAASASAAAAGLRNRLAALVAASRRGGTPGNPAAAQFGTSAPDAAGVCADVLVRLLERGQLLASTADLRGGAGLDCQRRYDALTPAKPE